jgi:hypothetical protein
MFRLNSRIGEKGAHMHRLVVNPGAARTWEIELKPGTNTLGRGEANDFIIADPSISTCHCQIDVSGESVRVLDLGSTNGTYLNGAQIVEGVIAPGQSLRLGNICLLLEETPPVRLLPETNPPDSDCTDEAAAVTVALAPERPPEPHVEAPPTRAKAQPAPAAIVCDNKPLVCRNHYQNLARYRCAKCSRPLCDLCVNTRGTAGGGLKFCKVCGTECERLEISMAQPVANFFDSVRDAFKYPFIGDGLILLIGGTFFFGFLDAANYISRNGMVFAMRGTMMRAVIITFVLGTGYMFSFLKNVIYTSALGDRHMPDWPEISEWQSDIVSPMFQFVMVTLLSFGPAIGVYVWADGDYPWLVALVALGGCIYFPMCFLGVAMFDSLAALNPLFVIGSILRVPREYSIATSIFIGILGVRWLCESAFTMLLHIPLVPTLVADLICLVLLIVEARILGLLYLSEKNTLGWFKNRTDPALERAARHTNEN